MDIELDKQLDLIIESKIGNLWKALAPEGKAGVITGIGAAGVGAAITVAAPAIIQAVHYFFRLFREKCKDRCEELRGEKQYNICYYTCKKDGIKLCIRKLESSRTKCKDDKCKKDIGEQIVEYRKKIFELENIVRKIK